MGQNLNSDTPDDMGFRSHSSKNEVQEQFLLGEPELERKDSRLNQRKKFLTTRFDKKSRKKLFDGKKFANFVKKGLKKEEIIPDKKFEKLPLIQNRYKVLRVLGQGAFGDVIKVVDQKTNQLFAIKSISLSMSGLKEKKDQKKKKRVIKSAETELNLLPRMSHKNVVRYISSFLLNRSPLKKEGGSTHLCLVMEYIKGSDLDNLLEFSEKNKFNISEEITIKWFVKLLKTLTYFHGLDIIHRDLKPDNILVCYEDLKDIDKMNLIISDFGVGKDINMEGLGHKISGHIFYCATEVLKMEEYDSRCDIWSLAIIFFQVYFGISTSTYQDKLRSLFNEVKENTDLNTDFCKKFKKKDIYDNVSFIELLLYIHQNNIFKERMLDIFTKENESIKTVLELMICPSKKRKYSTELLKHDIIRTWEFIVIREEEPDNLKFVDFDAFFNLFLSLRNFPDPIYNSLDILTYFVRNDTKKLKKFVDGDGLEFLCSKILNFDKNYDLCEKFFLFFLELIKKDNSNLKKVTILIREYCLTDILKKLILNSDNFEIYFFTMIMVKKCRTICHLFKDSVLPLFLKYNSTLNSIIFYILESIIPLITNQTELTKIFAVYKKNDILFFKKLKNSVYRSDELIMSEIMKRILGRLKELNVDKDRNVEEIQDNILMLLFCLCEEEKEKQTLKISEDFEKNNELQMIIQGNEENAQIDGKNIFCVSPKKELESIIISTKPICIMTKSDEKEFTLGYFEMYVADGGTTDSVHFGVNVDLEDIFYFRSDEGIIYKTENNQDKVFIRYLPINCFSGDHIGCGITSKGKMFFTYNNQIVKPFVDLKLREDAKVYSFIRISGNDFLKVDLNFGLKNFDFNFRNQKEEEVESSLNDDMDVKIKIIDILQKHRLKAEKKSPINDLCQKIIYFMKNDVKKIKDKAIISLYEKDNSFQKIRDENEKFNFVDREGIKKRKSYRYTKKGKFKLFIK